MSDDSIRFPLQVRKDRTEDENEYFIAHLNKPVLMPLEGMTVFVFPGNKKTGKEPEIVFTKTKPRTKRREDSAKWVEG